MPRKGGLLTRQDEEHKPVHDQHGPEDRHVENLKPRADKRDDNGPGSGMPELELRQAADEGAELVVLLGGESADGAVLHIVVERIVGRVELGLEEGKEEVEEVDAEGVCDCGGELVSGQLGRLRRGGRRAAKRTYRYTSPGR